MMRYECDNCGACCQGHLIVEAEALDIMREPRLLAAEPDLAGRPADEVIAEMQDDFGRVVVLACGTDRPCPFLAADAKCSIYPTRPNECVAMRAGDEQCQRARAAAGLQPLKPVEPGLEEARLWTIYHRDREYAREVGDPTLGQVLASSADEAVAKAKAGQWKHGGRGDAPTGYWAAPSAGSVTDGPARPS